MGNINTKSENRSLGISCVVPVYNEKERVIEVLRVLTAHPMIDEVIVVNDGSTDGSAEVLDGVAGIRFISYEKNMGKSHAVMLGIQAAKNPLILTVDSDLQGLAEEDITALVRPVMDGEVKFAMTLRKNSLGIFKLFGCDFVSGERIFSRDLIPDITVLDKLSPFGLEVFMNDLIVKKGLKIRVIKWKNVITPRKSVKYGFWKGVKGDLKMVGQIVRHLGVFGVIRQFWKMWRLKV